jgi:hypothetical protein
METPYEASVPWQAGNTDHSRTQRHMDTWTHEGLGTQALPTTQEHNDTRTHGHTKTLVRRRGWTASSRPNAGSPAVACRRASKTRTVPGLNAPNGI